MAVKAQILLTNDDGILSPGLWAAAEALSALGFVHVVAPRQQSSGAGRSLPGHSDGIIQLEEVAVNGERWQVHSVGGAPAQAVLHAIMEVLPQPPALVVSGINYGENVGSGVTISGTVGAALEAASFAIPALAVSLETAQEHHLSYSQAVDFSAAAHFTRLFAAQMLAKRLPSDVDVLKVEVPAGAGPDAPWVTTRQSRLRYFEPLPPQRSSWLERGVMGYRMDPQAAHDAPGSDVYALRVQRWVSVTPLSLDLTSRVDLHTLEQLLRGE